MKKSVHITRVYLGADHAGFKFKEKIKDLLKKKGLEVQDLSPKLIEGDDYPTHAFAVAERVAKHRGSRGILVCGTGTGMIIAANKVKGIRAAEAYDEYSAKMARNDNDTNILGLRARKFPFNKLKKVIEVWLNTPFSREKRHDRRIRKIIIYEHRK